MKNAVVTTRNKDKFRIVTEILLSFGLTNYSFKMLDSFKKYKEDKEVGTTEKRSQQKVKSFINFLNKNKKRLPDIIVGVDDGFKKKTDKKASPNSKEITQKILSGSYLKDNELVFDVRSYTFYIKDLDKYITINTEIPFRYVKKAKAVKFENSRYPLSNVLRYEESKNVVSEEKHINVKKYNKNYSKNLKSVVSIIKSIN